MNKTAILAGHTERPQGELKPFGAGPSTKDRPSQFNNDGRRQVIKNSSYIRPPVGAGGYQKASKRLVEMSDMMERSTSNNEDLMHLV